VAQSNEGRVVLRRGAELLECAIDAVSGLPAYTGSPNRMRSRPGGLAGRTGCAAGRNRNSAAFL
jgi:hypothetical protein